MRRLRTRRVDLGFLLLLFGILISGSQTADVDAKADDMAKRIEEQSKKVEDQSTKMVSEIEAKGKNVEDANQEKTFEEASKQVDDIMDQSEKEVDDKANFADELQNQADKKVEEIGKKIEETSNPGHGISRRRRASALVIRRPGIKKSPSGNRGAKRRMTVSYPVEVPAEETAGQQIEDVMKEGEHQIKQASEEKEKDGENTVSFSNPEDFSDHANNEAEETEDARYQVGDGDDSFGFQQQDYSSRENGNKDAGKVCLRHGQPIECAHESPQFEDKDENESEEIDSTRQDDSDALNFSDEQEGASEQNDKENEAGNIENFMVIQQREPTFSGFSDQQEDENEDKNTEHVSTQEDKGSKGRTILDDSALANNAFHENHGDTDNTYNKQPSTKKEEKGDDNEHDAAIYDVDVYTESSNSSSNATKMDQKGVENGTAEGSSAVASSTSTASGDGNDTHTDYSSPQSKTSDPRVEITFSPSAELLKPDQKLLNEIEEDRALRLKQKAKKQHAKELQDLGAAHIQLEKEFDSRWRQMGDVKDPEMLLRYPSLGKIVGKTGANQKISSITAGEVDFLQTEYPDYMSPDSRTNTRRKVELIVRDSVQGYKRKMVPKRKAKKNHLRKLLRKN